MATVDITLDVKPYRCEPCFEERGQHVQELVRMVPRSVVLNGSLVGDEWYCCPVCFDKKFLVKTRRAKDEEYGKRDKPRIPPARLKRQRKPEIRIVSDRTRGTD